MNMETIGAHQGFFHGQHDRLDELNSRLTDRLEQKQLRANLDFRSVPTRCTNIFPMIEPRKHSNVQLRGDASWITSYTNNVNIESDLRNQYTPMGSEVYVPSSTSDLYKIEVANSSNMLPNECVHLFDKHSYTTTGNKLIEHSIGKLSFNNNTKVQMRGMGLER